MISVDFSSSESELISNCNVHKMPDFLWRILKCCFCTRLASLRPKSSNSLHKYDVGMFTMLSNDLRSMSADNFDDPVKFKRMKNRAKKKDVLFDMF